MRFLGAGGLGGDYVIGLLCLLLLCMWSGGWFRGGRGRSLRAPQVHCVFPGALGLGTPASAPARLLTGTWVSGSCRFSEGRGRSVW